MRKAGLAIFLVFAIGSAARADEVTAWNNTLFRSGVVAGSSSQNMSRFAALVQTAVFDSVNGIERRYTPIHVAPAGPAGASSSAAAAQAAYSILSRLYGQGGLFTPNQQATLDASLAASLARIARYDSAAAIKSGRDWGQTVGDAIWTWRSTDGFSLAAPTWEGFTTLGQLHNWFVDNGGSAPEPPLATDSDEGAMGKYFHDHYVVIHASVRGTGCSAGEFDLFRTAGLLDLERGDHF